MASPLQGGHWEATLFSPCYNWDWIKSCSIFSQSWQLSFFFKMTPNTLTPPPARPPTTIQLETHLKKGMRGRGMRNGWVVLWRSVWGVRRQGCTSLSRHHARLSPTVCGSVRFTFHLVGDSRTESVTHIPEYFVLQAQPYGAVSGLSVSDRFPTFLFHRLWRIFLFY